VVGADNWAILAEFDFKPEAGSTRISNALIYFIQLLLWMGLTALLLQAAVRRLNP
jgi:ABC-2 type transport system permease protein